MNNVHVVTCTMQGYDDEPGSDTSHIVGVFSDPAVAARVRKEHDTLPYGGNPVKGQAYHMLSFYSEVTIVPVDDQNFSKHYMGA